MQIKTQTCRASVSDPLLIKASLYMKSPFYPFLPTEGVGQKVQGLEPCPESPWPHIPDMELNFHLELLAQPSLRTEVYAILAGVLSCSQAKGSPLVCGTPGELVWPLPRPVAQRCG
jgi:hypothetical protein